MKKVILIFLASLVLSVSSAYAIRTPDPTYEVKEVQVYFPVLDDVQDTFVKDVLIETQKHNIIFVTEGNGNRVNPHMTITARKSTLQDNSFDYMIELEDSFYPQIYTKIRFSGGTPIDFCGQQLADLIHRNWDYLEE